MAQDPNGYRIPAVPEVPAPVTDPNGTVQDFTQTPAGGYVEQPLQAVPQPGAEGAVQDVELPATPARAAPAASSTATSGGLPPTGVVTVPGANGQPVRVALSGLSPAKQAEYGGMADVNAYGRGVAKDQADIRKDLKQAGEAEGEAIRQQASAAAVRQDEQYRLQRQAYAQQKEMDAHAAEDQAHYQAIANQRDSDVQRLVAEQGQMTFDPDRYMKNRSAGTSMLQSISIALGAIGQAAIPGSRNIGLDMLTQAAEHDVQAQHEAYNRKGAQIGQAKDAYAQARQMGMDHNQATLAARQVALQQLESGLKVVGAKYASAETVANRDVALAHVAQERAKTQADFAKTVHAEASQFIALRQQQRAFTANRDDEQWNRALELGKLGIEGQRADAAERAAAVKAQKGALTVGGWEGEVPTKEVHAKATEIASNERVVVPKIDELIQFRKKYGNETYDRSELAKARSTAAQLKVMLKDKFGLGVMSESDSELLDRVAADPTKVAWTPAVVAQLENLKRQTMEDTESQLDVMGLQRSKANKLSRPKFDERPVEGGRSE
jgi:hypothetical protein